MPRAGKCAVLDAGMRAADAVTMDASTPPWARPLDPEAALHRALFTGMVLGVVAHRGAEAAERLVFRALRIQQQERFLPGLRKLGLDGLPHAVACARYHMLSNAIGGVRVHCIEESPRKAWVVYPAPRWVWWGTAVCGIPARVSAAMLRGWHAHNGVSLGNPRLGFVCTGQVAAGDAALSGYYHEADRPLAEEERLRFSGEAPPPPGPQPVLPSDSWPEERLARAARGFALEWARSLTRAAAQEFDDGLRHDLLRAARQVGLQFAHTLPGPFAPPELNAGPLGRAVAQALARGVADALDVPMPEPVP